MSLNNLKYIFAFCSFLPFVSSCSDKGLDDAIPDTPQSKGVRMTFSAGFEAESSRAAFAGSGDNKTIVWKAGDKISVFTQTKDYKNVEFTLDEADANTSSGHFTGTTADADNYAALYPYKGYVSQSASDYSKLQMVTIPDCQAATENTFDPQAAPMIGVTTKADSYYIFKNICSFLKITPPVACKSITIETTESAKYLTGSVNVSYNSGTPTWSLPTGSNYPLSNKVTLVGDMTAGTTYYVAVLPTASVSGLRITYQTADNKYLAVKSTANVSFVRSSYHDVSLTESSLFNSAKDAYVDLGVSVLWATRNLGASKPSEVGSFYAWGEIAPLNGCDEANDYNIIETNAPVKTEFNDQTYKWGDGSAISADSYHMTKYSAKFPSDHGEGQTIIIDGDNLTTLQSADDAANYLWGNGARIPSRDECQDLVQNCFWEYYETGSVKGFWVYKAKVEADKGMLRNITTLSEGLTSTVIKDLKGESRTAITSEYTSSDARIFLPFTGFYNDGSSFTAGDTGYYWSSTLCLPADGKGDNTLHYEQAYDLMLKNAVDGASGTSNLPQIHTDYRRGGQCIRPVKAN